jgi:hypothetical protein
MHWISVRNYVAVPDVLSSTTDLLAWRLLHPNDPTSDGLHQRRSAPGFAKHEKLRQGSSTTPISAATRRSSPDMVDKSFWYRSRPNEVLAWFT